MKQIINAVYGNLQRLEIQPTKHNIGILGESLRSLEELYKLADQYENQKPGGETPENRDEANGTQNGEDEQNGA